MKRKYPLRPAHPERICWGCDKLCAADDMRCGNGTDRGQHPIELWGEDWMNIGLGTEGATPAPVDEPSPPEGSVVPGGGTLGSGG